MHQNSPFFHVIGPSTEETPLVVEVPHASIRLDPESLAYCIAPARSIGRDADLFVDELFADAPDCGATSIVASVSRYVCDLNRAETELDSHTTPDGASPSAPHGVIWRRTTSGQPALGAPLPGTEVKRRIAALYHPYHRTLDELLEEKQKRFGYAILLCGHSMPSFGRLGDRRADVVPGSRSATTAARPFLETMETVAKSFDFDVAHDSPYRGGYTTGYHGRPDQARHAIQIELARRLYMDELRLTRKSVDFERTREFCRCLVARLGATSP